MIDLEFVPKEAPTSVRLGISGLFYIFVAMSAVAVYFSATKSNANKEENTIYPENQYKAENTTTV